jgi:hypothetical protein
VIEIVTTGTIDEIGIAITIGIEITAATTSMVETEVMETVAMVVTETVPKLP